MKSNSQPSLYFSPFSVKFAKQEPTSAKTDTQSPYLKAVLSDKRPSGRARVLSLGNSTMAAALRYITNKR